MANPGRSDSFLPVAMTEEELHALERELWADGQAVSNIDDFANLSQSVETIATDTLGGENVAASYVEYQPGDETTDLVRTPGGGCYVVGQQHQNLTMQQQQSPDLATQMTERLIDYQLRGGDQQVPTMPLQVITGPPPPSATSANPTMVKWSGRYGFSIAFRRLSKNTRNKGWDFSFDLNKLFIDMGKDVMTSFRVTAIKPEEERMPLFVRATPVYAVASHLHEPVVRCPIHASADHPSNEGFPPSHHLHLIRMNHDEASYHIDLDSGRLSVLVPMKRPQGGAVGHDVPIKFMCLGSDAGGMNRRPVKVIFTLETEDGEVVGRQNVDVRVCSCPKRDRGQEERRAAKGTKQARHIASQLGRQTSLCQKTNSFARDDDTILIPICRRDKKLMEELVEGMACRANQSRSNRRRLLEACHRGEKALKREPTTDW